MRIRKLGVVGAGTMGGGIAALAASAGVPVVLLDVPASEGKGGRDAVARNGLERAKKSKPAAFMDLERAAMIRTGNTEDHLDLLAECDLVVEAIIEQLEPKRALYARLETVLPEHAIIASNTSGIPIHSLLEGRGAGFRSRFLGMHFFNPPRYLHLLEIIPTPETSPETVAAARHFSDRILGKGIVVARDVPGFVANRLGVFGMVLAIRQMEKHGLTIDEADVLTGVITGRSKSATFRTADLSGIDVIAHVTAGLSQTTGEDFSLSPWVLELVKAGRVGEKTGAGFYRRVGKEIHTLDWRAGEYTPQSLPSTAELVAHRQTAASRTLRRDPRVERPGRRVRARVLVTILSLRALDDADDRVRSPRRRSRDGVGLRLGRRAVRADGPARRRIPAPGLRATSGSTSRPCCAKRATASTRPTEPGYSP